MYHSSLGQFLIKFPLKTITLKHQLAYGNTKDCGKYIYQLINSIDKFVILHCHSANNKLEHILSYDMFEYLIEKNLKMVFQMQGNKWNKDMWSWDTIYVPNSRVQNIECSLFIMHQKLCINTYIDYSRDSPLKITAPHQRKSLQKT